MIGMHTWARMLNKKRKRDDHVSWPQPARCSFMFSAREDQDDGFTDVEIYKPPSSKVIITKTANRLFEFNRLRRVRGLRKLFRASPQKRPHTSTPKKNHVASQQKNCTSDFGSYLPLDVTTGIISDVGNKAAAMLKLASKQWNTQVYAQLSQFPIKNLSGLVIQDERYLVYYLKLDSKGGAAQCTPCLYPLCRFHILNTCKGLVLCKTCPEVQLCVYNPTASTIDRLPRAFESISGRVMGSVYGLTVDSHGGYKVVTLFTFLRDEKCVLKIFSSDTKETKVVSILVPDLASNFRSSRFGVFVAHKGVYYFLIKNWVLVYQVKDGFNKFLRLPRCGIPTHSPYIWMTEERLYYAFGCDEPNRGFQIWELVLEGSSSNYNDYKFGDDNDEHWQLRHHHLHCNLKRDYPSVFEDEASDSCPGFSPCTFNEDFKILYLCLPGLMVAYHLNTRSFTKTLSVRTPLAMVKSFYFGLEEAPKTLEYEHCCKRGIRRL